MSSGYERLGDIDRNEDFYESAQNNASVNKLGSPQSFAKPPTYYGEGPFDAPSSPSESEDERASFLEKSPTLPPTPGLAELAMGGSGLRLGGEDSEKRHASLRFLAILLAGVLAFSACIGIIAATTYYERPTVLAGHKKFSLDHVFNGTFGVKTKTIDWVPEAGDGVFSLLEDNAIKLVDLKTNTTKVLVSRWDIKDEHGNPLSWSNWKLSPDMKYILLKANWRKQWRWSSFGNYYIHDIAAKQTHPMIPPTNPSSTAYATWAPTGQSIAYVTNNDLYVLPSPSSSAPIRVTTSGNASLFHGVPDWVYEEEVFSADFALWWSPDAHKIAFLRLDETEVDEYNYPVYNPSNDGDAVVPYTSDIVMKYPKPGYNNPLVSVHVFDLAKHLESAPHKTGAWDDAKTQDFPDEENTYELQWPNRHPSNDSIVLEVAWVGNASLIVKEVNRNADSGNVVLFELDSATTKPQKSTGKVVRKLGAKGEEGDEGWIDQARICEQNITPVPHNLTEKGQDAYLDILPNSDGYNHIALFSPASSGTPQFLTSGKWEVTDGIQSVDAKSGLVYFQAAKPSSIERNIYSVPLPKGANFKIEEPKPLTDETKPSFYSASFSPQSGYYWLNYQGPSIPWQKIVQVGNDTFKHILEENEALKNATMEYEAPTVIRSTIMSDGYELNTQEFRPPHMDDSGRVKYPVLFRVYGGPASQIIDLRFARNWHDWLACSLSYIVVNVDGRGTGFKGRHLRNPVKGNLGFYETIDQINAAKIWAAKTYVDRKRIGIWGWSYGGFMSSKVVEANAGVHSLAIAVAPVTSWRLYDSIYTERYMNTPQLNPGGYVNASISNVTGFHHVDYLLAHGSGDDNVHFSNTAHLLDMFTKGKVRNFRFRMFTDSDHSINRRGALRELYEYMTTFLVEKWGKGGRNTRGW